MRANEEERLFVLECVARLSHVLSPAMKAARDYAIRTKTKGTQQRYRRMRDAAESMYCRFRAEAVARELDW